MQRRELQTFEQGGDDFIICFVYRTFGIFLTAKKENFALTV